MIYTHATTDVILLALAASVIMGLAYEWVCGGQDYTRQKRGRRP